MTTDELLSVAYVSDATQAHSEEDLGSLLQTSREHNEAVGVTGMLVHRDGRFVQVLEGPENVTRDLLARIVKDPRHENVRFLVVQRIRRRSFGEWTMGYEPMTVVPDKVPRGFRSTFDDLEDDDSVVVQRALRELAIWFRARHRETAGDS